MLPRASERLPREWGHSNTDRGSLFQRDDGTKLETFTYDALGNLTRVERDNAPPIDYIIDAQGHRVSKHVGGILRKQYVWSSALRIVAERDPINAVTSRFIYGHKPNVPDLISRFDGGSTRLYRVITDHLGSPVYVVNIADPNDVLLDASYDEWGKVTQYTSLTGTWPIPFGFAGGLYDEDTGLVRFGARDYDPRIGRWTSKDPIGFAGGQANLYTYVGSDPLTLSDPEGKFVFLAVPAVYWAAGGGAAILITAYATGALQNPFPVLVNAGQSVWNSIALAKDNRSPDRKALDELRDEAMGRGDGALTRGDAEVLAEWARELGTKGRVDDAHPGTRIDFPHAHIGSEDHIPICEER